MFEFIKSTILYTFIGFLALICLFGAFPSTGDSQTSDSQAAASAPVESNAAPISILYNYDTSDPAPDDSSSEINYAGADGHIITIQHNPNALDPTYDQVISFLKSDTTDQIPYEDGSFVCGDYAENVQHNAENAGFKCGWVVVEFANKEGGHACNVFNTTDKGLVFVDCTGFDSVVDLKNGQEYHPVTLSKLLGYSNVETDPMGIVKSYSVKW